MDKLTKARVLDHLYSIETIYTKSMIKDTLNEVIDSMVHYLTDLKSVRFSKSGKLVPLFKPGGRPVRNPKTGEAFTMGDVYSISFRTLENSNKNDHNPETINTSQLITRVAESDIVQYHAKNLGASSNLSGRHLEKHIREHAHAATGLVVRTLMAMFKDARDCSITIEFRGLGSFHTCTTKHTHSRNPKTGESFALTEPLLRTSFREGSLIKKALKQKLA